MCSIIGYCGPVADLGALQRGFGRTVSRGPDDSRVLRAGDGLLGFHRLSIMGLTPEGMQPFEREGSCCVCNGEIYGFERLRKILEGKGYAFRSGSDCEILLPLYREYGTAMFAMLDAEFACVIYDGAAGEFIAARDPIGIRPLYYGHDRSGSAVFASEPKNLVGIVEHILPFPPGHYYKDGRFVCYRDIAQVERVCRDGMDAICANIREKLIAGVEKRLVADAKVGFLLSGGLDSSLAVLITAKAFDLLGRDRKGILAVTMPCFGTTRRTRSNAELLAAELGTDFLEVNIGKAVEQHFADIGQSVEDHSVTFENAQARERTQVLMDLANQRGGLVIGTGDLSELALGWATYNGDHMSMYAVNASIPKTLVRHLTAWEAERLGGRAGEVLRDILNTPVSPELLPPKDGEIAQITEDLVGPYELHDFYLYYAIRWGFPPRKVLRLASRAFEGRYDRETLLKWLKNFYRRFFAQQFKRSCLPDGPKVGSVSLSPRGDWRMPSDAVARLWLDELENL